MVGQNSSLLLGIDETINLELHEHKVMSSLKRCYPASSVLHGHKWEK